jgi:segregation and condensation protein A
MSKPDLRLIEGGPPPVVEASTADLAGQTEMPFAVVEGEPVTQMPRDLYIPPEALQVFLEAFEGPLDLLLYLIRRQNLDILDIPIAEITRQYMRYIELMRELQLELAGEYLLMAATLAEIKSRMLLPRPQSESGEEGTTRAPNSCVACRSTSASSRPPWTSRPCHASTATPSRRRRSSGNGAWCACCRR